MKRIKLTVLNACEQEWHRMNELAHGRYCTLCSRSVIDFTAMTDRELADYYNNPQGPVCGRFAAGQLQRSLAVIRKPRPWSRQLFRYVLPAFLFSSTACAGVNSGSLESVQYGDRVEWGNEGKWGGDTLISLSGVIKDEGGNAVAGAHISLDSGKNFLACTNEEGFFSIQTVKAPFYNITVSAIGFVTLTACTSSPSVSISLSNLVMGEVMVLPVKKKKRVKQDNEAPMFRKIVDTLFSPFTVYPNPARPGATVLLDLKRIPAGEYDLSLHTLSGEMVQSKKVQVKRKGSPITYQLPLQPAGVYLLRFTSIKGKAYNSRVVVQ